MYAELKFLMEKEEPRVKEEMEQIKDEDLIYLDYYLASDNVSSIEVHEDDSSVLSSMMDLLEELNIPYDYKKPVFDGDTRITIFRPKTEESDEIRIESYVDPNSYRDDLSLDMEIEMYRIAEILDNEKNEKKAIKKIKELIGDYYKVKSAGTL